VTTTSPGTTGYYETASGTNTFRISRRMHTVSVPGTYPVNDGVITRIYFNAEDTTFIRTDPSPTTPINFWGWMKVVLDDPQAIVNSMNTAAPELPVPSEIVVPIATGTEGGLRYADFLTETFSTFIYFASTVLPLPVEFNYFTVEKQGDEALLSWETASEINNDYFDIIRSPDATYWVKIGQAKGAGTSNEPTSYQFIDRNPLIGTNYYRLLQVDFDGSETLLPIRSVAFETAKISLTTYPNPVSDVLYIAGLGDNRVSIAVLNALGQKVMLWSEFQSIEEITQVDMSHLPSGAYLVLIQSGSGMRTFKVAK